LSNWKPSWPWVLPVPFLVVLAVALFFGLDPAAFRAPQWPLMIGVTLFIAVASVVVSLLAMDRLRAGAERELAQVRIEAEQRARELEAFMEAMPVGVMITRDQEGQYITGNRATHELLRVPPRERNISKSVPDPGGLRTYRPVRNGVDIPPEELPIQRAARGEEVRDWDCDLVFADGSVRHVLVNATPFRDESGVSRGAIAGFLDITERVRAEEALRESEAKANALIRYASTGIYEIDYRGPRFVSVNDAMCRILGYTREELLSIGPGALLDDANRARFAERIRRQLAGEPIDDSVEYRVRKKDGTLIDAVLHVSFDVTGREPHKVLVVAHDVTERKRAEEALRRAHDELEVRVRERTAELERRTRQLRSLTLESTQAESRERKRLSTVIHDHLQQLLVGAKLGVQVAQRYAEQGPAGEPGLRDSIRNVGELLDEGIRASRSLMVELSPPILHEAGLVAGFKWLARWMEEKHGLAVTICADRDIAPDATGVSALLFQSVRELLFNVIKHSGVQEAQVETCTLDGDLLQVLVADRGAGFDVARAEGRGSDGGFGLFSIRERIDLLGGRMSIESAPGGGTRVTLVAPLPPPTARRKPSDLAEPSDAQPAVARSPAGPRPGAPIRIVVADDHRIVREGLVMVIQEEADMEVVGEASDGVEAVEMARRVHPDVVIMDVSMPRMNGIEATAKIVAEMPEVRVIGLSMYEHADREETMRAAGAVAYLTKDGPSGDLIRAVRASAPGA